MLYKSRTSLVFFFLFFSLPFLLGLSISVVIDGFAVRLWRGKRIFGESKPAQLILVFSPFCVMNVSSKIVANKSTDYGFSILFECNRFKWNHSFSVFFFFNISSKFGIRIQSGKTFNKIENIFLFVEKKCACQNYGIQVKFISVCMYVYIFITSLLYVNSYRKCSLYNILLFSYRYVHT